MATIGGDDQITVLRHLDPARMLARPKRFLGYSDNTNLSNWLWFHGIGGVYGGSTAVHLGPGPRSTRCTWPRCGPRCSAETCSLSPPERTFDYGRRLGLAVGAGRRRRRTSPPRRGSGPGRLDR